MPNNTVAYGFIGLENVMASRLNTVNGEVIRRAIDDTFQEYNRQATQLIGTVAARTVRSKRRYTQAGSSTLQPLDQWGNPIPVKDRPSYDVAFPIKGGGTAWGNNRVSRALMTVQEENDNAVDAMRADADWLVRHALAALFTNVTYTYQDELDGALTIQPLANGDAVTYLTKGGAVAADNHFAAQAAAIADATNPFPGIYDELTEHPGNGNVVISYIPTNLKTAVQGLAEFILVPDPNVMPGGNQATLTSNGQQALRMGDAVLGYLKSSKIWVVEWKKLPNDYVVSLSPDGDAVLGMREYDATELQGFFPEFHSPDGNLQVKRMIRYAGFGVSNRVGAHVQRVGNGAYAIPTGFQAPLAV